MWFARECQEVMLCIRGFSSQPCQGYTFYLHHQMNSRIPSVIRTFHVTSYEVGGLILT